MLGLKSIKELSDYITRVYFIKGGGQIQVSLIERNGVMMPSGGMISLVSGYRYFPGEEYWRGLLIDLVRVSGKASGLMVVLLYKSLASAFATAASHSDATASASASQKQVLVQCARMPYMPYDASHSDAKHPKEWLNLFEKELNEQMDLLGGGGHVHLDAGCLSMRGGVSYSIEAREGYLVEDVRYLHGSTNESGVLEGAVIWCIGELASMTKGVREALDIGGVVKDFLECEDFVGRDLLIFGVSEELRYLMPKGSSVNNARVRVIELKGVDSRNDLKDIEAYTGGSILKGEYGYAQRVVVGVEGSLVIEPYYEDRYVESTERRVSELLNRKGSYESVSKDEGIDKRVAKLRGVLIQVAVGGVTEAESRWKRGEVELKIKEVMEKRRSGVVKGRDLMRALGFPSDWENEEEYSYEEVENGLRRVDSLVEVLSKVSLVIPERKKRK